MHICVNGPWDMAVILKDEFSNSYYTLISWVFPGELLSYECHRNSLMTVPSHQLRAWGNVDLDLCHHMVSLGNNELKSSNELQWLDSTHWGRVTHICIGNLTIIIGSDNSSSPGQHQAIIWTNARILLIGPLGIKFSEILIEIPTFSVTKRRLNLSSAKWRPFCLCLSVLNHWVPVDLYL